MRKVNIDGQRQYDIVCALREKAEADRKRVEELKDKRGHERIADAFRDQADRQEKLADEIEDASTVSLVFDDEVFER